MGSAFCFFVELVEVVELVSMVASTDFNKFNKFNTTICYSPATHTPTGPEFVPGVLRWNLLFSPQS